MSKRKPKIAVIGGGNGVSSVLSGLKKYPVDLSAIVTMADNGGSTGILRKELKVLPAGDIRRALAVLAKENILGNIFNNRFERGFLKGHALGNIVLASLEIRSGNFYQAVEEAEKLLKVSGRVYPSTLADIHLFAELENGIIIKGETDIDIPKHDSRLKIKRVFLNRKAEIFPQAREFLLRADLIVIGPGDIYTSVVPNFLVSGMKSVLKNTHAKKIYIANPVTKLGESHSFKLSDFLSVIEKYGGEGMLDYVIANTGRISAQTARRLKKKGLETVKIDRFYPKPSFILKNLLDSAKEEIRYDPLILADAIISLL